MTETPPPAAGAGRRWLWLAAVASGAATLVYEIAWIRDLSLVIGARYPAVAVVLAAFMLGLGLGSLGGGWLADRLRRPAFGYVGVELAVALLAGTFPLAVGWVATVDEVPFIGPVSTRAVLAGLTLLPATALMGATFPFLSKALHRGDSGASHVPLLYVANTVGAVLGAGLGGLILPFVVGLPLTELAAVALNLVAAGLAAVAASRLGVIEGPGSRRDGGGAVDLRAVSMLVLAFCSGALVLGAEVFWTRVALQIDRTAYQGLVVEPADVITLILLLVLAGSVAGGVVAHLTRAWEGARVARLLVWVFAGVSVSCLAGLEWVGVTMLGLGSSAPRDWPAFVPILRLIPLVPACVLMGTSFPLLARLYAGADRGHGVRMGVVWTVNTAGAVLGSIGAGWFVIPVVGAGPGLVLCGGLAVVCAGICVLWMGRDLGWRPTELGAVGAGVVALGLVAALVPLGPGRWYAARYGEDAIIDAWEGWEATTLVVELPAKGRSRRMLFTNGREIRWDRGLVNKVRFFRPAAERARDVLLVGFGTGAMAREILGFQALEHLVVVEIDGAQFKAGEWFGTADVVTDPRVTVVVDDALHYLAVTERRFDAILLDAWGPESSPSLYTWEFHDLARHRLTDIGVVAAKLNPIDDDSLTAVIDAVRCSYPFAYRAGAFGAVLGSRAELPATEGLEALTSDPPCSPLLHRYPRRIGAANVGKGWFKGHGAGEGAGGDRPPDEGPNRDGPPRDGPPRDGPGPAGPPPDGTARPLGPPGPPPDGSARPLGPRGGGR